MASPARPAISKRACDACRRRKVKCDASAPACANCRISLLPCQYKSQPRKRGRKPARGGVAVDPVRPHHADDSPQGQFFLDVRSPEPARPGPPGLASPPSSSTHEFPLCSVPSEEQAIYEELVASASEVLPSDASIDEVADACVSAYMQYAFPGAPICHEPTLRASVLLFFARAASSRPGPPSSTPLHLFAAGPGSTTPARVATMRNFALLTAVCAAMAYLVPETLLPHGRLVGPAFLRAARRMLKLFEDDDYERPTSYSLNTRIMLSFALQHATGKTAVAWHVLGQARLLAQDLALHDERSLARYDPVEARLLRLNFWLLFTADKTAVVLGCRPVTFHEGAFGSSELTLRGCDDDHDRDHSSARLFDVRQRHFDPRFEDRVLGGFHVIREIWSRAAAIVEGVRLRGRRRPWAGLAMGPGDGAALVADLTQRYFDFAALLDSVPPWIESPDGPHAASEDAARYQAASFWILRVGIFVSFHCADMMILCSAIQHHMTAIMGLDLQPLTLAMQKTQIGYNFLRVLQGIPLKYLQVGGEPVFEKIRVVASTLLELVEEADNESIKARARLCVERLLDVLAQLDSRARDELHSSGGQVILPA